MLTILFESHSTSDDNLMGRASGWFDPALSPEGELQAKQLGIRYAKTLISTVYVSDLKRSYTTAKLAFEDRNIPIVKDSRLREWNYGDYNGTPNEKLEKLKEKHIEIPFPNGESLSAVLDRFCSFKNQCLKTHDEYTVLIIGHRATYYALEHYHNNIPLKTLLTSQWNWQPGWHYTL